LAVRVCCSAHAERPKPIYATAGALSAPTAERHLNNGRLGAGRKGTTKRARSRQNAGKTPGAVAHRGACIALQPGINFP